MGGPQSGCGHRTGTGRLGCWLCRRRRGREPRAVAPPKAGEARGKRSPDGPAPRREASSLATPALNAHRAELWEKTRAVEATAFAGVCDRSRRTPGPPGPPRAPSSLPGPLPAPTPTPSPRPAKGGPGHAHSLSDSPCGVLSLRGLWALAPPYHAKCSPETPASKAVASSHPRHSPTPDPAGNVPVL